MRISNCQEVLDAAPLDKVDEDRLGEREGGIGCETLVTAEWGRDGCPGLSSSSSPPPSLPQGETGAVCAAEGAHQVRTVHTQLAALNRHGERAAGPA